jgi:hypothetical protein
VPVLRKSSGLVAAGNPPTRPQSTHDQAVHRSMSGARFSVEVGVVRSAAGERESKSDTSAAASPTESIGVTVVPNAEGKVGINADGSVVTETGRFLPAEGAGIARGRLQVYLRCADRWRQERVAGVRAE